MEGVITTIRQGEERYLGMAEPTLEERRRIVERFATSRFKRLDDVYREVMMLSDKERYILAHVPPCSAVNASAVDFANRLILCKSNEEYVKLAKLALNATTQEEEEEEEKKTDINIIVK